MRLGQAIFSAAAGLLTWQRRRSPGTPAQIPLRRRQPRRPRPLVCHAYQQAADGSWTQRPCQETGSKASAQPHPPQKSATEETQ